MLTKYSGIWLITTLLPVYAWGQQAKPSTPATVRASGEAVVSVKPDQAKIDIGVVTQAPTAQAAASQNAAQTQAVLEKLRSTVGPKTDIKTISYSVGPNYQYPRDGGKPTIAGYTATNNVEVTTNDLGEVGKLIDTATSGGANQISRLQFGLQDEKPARAQALRAASREARANAEAMASSLGLTLGPVISLEQGVPELIRPRMAMAAQVAGTTPVEPGAIEVHATVTLTMALQ
jgi:uncharacterized protein YggE